MRKRLLLIGLLVVGVALLSSCDVLDQIIDGITGGGSTGGGTPGGGTATPGAVVKVAISYNLEATILQRIMHDYAPAPSPETVITASFVPNSAPNHTANNTYTISWNGQGGAEYADTYLEVRLNAAGNMIEYFHVRQTQLNVWFAWTYVDEIRGYNVPLSTSPAGADPNSRYFILKGVTAHATVDRLVYKRWPPAREGYSVDNPETWANSHNDIISSASNTITIRLDY